MLYREGPPQYFALVARKAFGYYPCSLGYVECQPDQSGPILLEPNQPYYFEGNTMTPNEYQVLASRTECDQEAASRRWHNANQLDHSNFGTRLNHSVIGLMGEVGELAGALEKYFQYGLYFDRVNIYEELGDCLWYLALACNTLGISLEEVMQKNIAKLQQRYPEKYSDSLAAEQNRDREKERQVIMDGGYAETDAFVVPTIVSGEVKTDTVPTTDIVLNKDYSQKCGQCGRAIHRTNTVGVCSDCYSRIKVTVE